MAVVRFPNSQSNVERVAELVTLLANRYQDSNSQFSLDDMRDVLAGHNQISSSGASGSLAVARSTRSDRSRDPLYNQVKMMSEIYRMLGWIRSSESSRLSFRLTNLGLTLGLDAKSVSHETHTRLIRESLLRVVFPNETTTNHGVENHRPFSWLIRLMKEMDGFITRDEIIVGVLAVVDDRQPGIFQKTVSQLLDARVAGTTSGLVKALSLKNGIQVNTLRNYTRLPIGVLSSAQIGWAVPRTVITLDSRKPLRGWALTELGTQTADELSTISDLRLEMLKPLSPNDRAVIANYSYFELMKKALISDAAMDADLENLAPKVKELLGKLGLTFGSGLLFNPECQETEQVLNMASNH